jgi:hypothetical protein
MTTIHLYDVGSREPVTTEAVDEASVQQALNLHDGDVLVVVDDSDHGDGGLTDIDITRTVADLSNGRTGLVLLRNPLARVTVTVSYAGTMATLHVHAATRVRRIRRLAVRNLGLDDATAADTSIRLVGSDEDLSPNRPIGAYLANGEHEIALDLVHRVRPQG